MNNRADIAKELQDIGSVLADLPATLPYLVPDSYFRTFDSDLLATIKKTDDPELTLGAGKSMPFDLPSGFFNENATKLVRVAIENEQLMDGITIGTPFSAPVDYFKLLPDNMLIAAKASEKSGVKPKTISFLNPSFKSIQLAAAAIFVLFVCIGSFVTFSGNKPANPEIILASLSGKEINEYIISDYRIDINRVEGQNKIADLQLNNKEIIEYLNETGWDVVDN